MSTALLTSYEKNEALLRLAKMLVENGWNLLGSAGTTGFLKENGIACKDVADTVGPPILGHRVVTLSREIYAGLLAATPEDFAEMKRMNISNIDLVYVNLYPLEKETQNPQATPESVLEKTDIGGPTLLRAAAKSRPPEPHCRLELAFGGDNFGAALALGLRFFRHRPLHVIGK